LIPIKKIKKIVSIFRPLYVVGWTCELVTSCSHHIACSGYNKGMAKGKKKKKKKKKNKKKIKKRSNRERETQNILR